MSRTAIYAGSFDPFTLGHLDILRRGLAVFDRIIVSVATNIRKAPLFNAEERVALVREAVGDDPRVDVDTFGGLLVDHAKQRDAVALLRGLRAVSDFDFEFQMASMNASLASGIQTVFLMAGEDHFYVSSSLVKEVAMLGGDISAHVPACVEQALQQRIGGRR